ncbi:MAG: histidine kinase [Gemmatimonadaceae bacterium]|nr:histidine kinase [Gemmatimonadaceae bacterium]
MSRSSQSRIRPWMFVSAVWLWPAVLNVVNRVLQVRIQGWDAPTARDLLFVAGDWLLYALVTPIIFWISGRWPVVKSRLRERVLIHVAWALLFCVVWAVGGKVLELLLTLVLSPGQLRDAIAAAGSGLFKTVSMNVAGWILITLPFGVVVYATVAGMAHAINYFTEARERELQMARLSEQLASARFSALQAQLNPHFLFNTLNTIAVFVRDGDRTGAVQIVEQLSDVLRRTLRRHQSHEVALSEELELIRQYLAIEHARFPDRLGFTIEAADPLSAAAVPGFAVQHLVENAIKHGIARREEAGQLAIVARRDHDTLVITVVDDGPGLSKGEMPAGHGLENTRERLKALYGAAASLELHNGAAGGVIATLRLPYREVAVEMSDDEQ